MKTSVKRLACMGCGAGLVPKEREVNVQCSYCGVASRVVSESDSIKEVLLEKLAEAKIEDKFDKAKHFILRGQYKSAKEVLDQILVKEPKLARAWFLKSVLPVLEQDSVLFKGHYVNLSRISKMTKVEEVYDYLKTVGVPFYQRRSFIRWYQSNDFLYEQQIKFLEKAIEFSQGEERAQYETEMKLLVAEQKRKLKKDTLVVLLLFGGFGVVSIIAMAVLVWYYGT